MYCKDEYLLRKSITTSREDVIQLPWSIKKVLMPGVSPDEVRHIEFPKLFDEIKQGKRLFEKD
jgi:hypothetical protein